MRIFEQNPKATQQAAVAKAAIPTRALGASPILHFQRAIGNQAIQRLLEKDVRGAKGGSTTTETNRFGHAGSIFANKDVNPNKLNRHAQLVAGDQEGEAEDVALGGEFGGSEAAAQPAVGAIGGDATSISTSDLYAAEWLNNGRFKWWVRWVTDGTSGWIVQKLENTYSGRRADGTAITNASVGLTPLYYEAWEVDSTGTITGSLGTTGNRDRWERPNLGALSSSMSFSMRGAVYWTSRNPALSGFTSGGVTNAGSLLSSTSAPAGIGLPLISRSAYGAWHADGSRAEPGCFTS